MRPVANLLGEIVLGLCEALLRTGNLLDEESRISTGTYVGSGLLRQTKVPLLGDCGRNFFCFDFSSEHFSLASIQAPTSRSDCRRPSHQCELHIQVQCVAPQALLIYRESCHP